MDKVNRIEEIKSFLKEKTREELERFAFKQQVIIDQLRGEQQVSFDALEEEQRKGFWKEHERMTLIWAGYGYVFEVAETVCSNCGKVASHLWVREYGYNGDYEYCPHCGAKMEEQK